VVGIDPSPRARLRRLLHRTAEEATSPIIEWTQLEPFVGHVPTSRLRLPARKLAQLHPAQIADLVEAASHEQGEEIIEAVRQQPELEADVFEELDEHHQLEFIRERPDDQVAQVLARMATDDAADLIAELEQERREPVLARLPAAKARQIKALLGYNASTAGGLMSPELVAVPETASAREALEQVKKSEIAPEALTTIYTTGQDGTLTGAIPVVALLRAPPEEPVAQVATTDLVHVHTDADITEVARLMTDYNLTMLPVLDGDDKPVGVVTVDDVLELTLPTDWRRRFGVLAEQ
jgi:Mg/Co/Ni transporter MgtE